MRLGTSGAHVKPSQVHAKTTPFSVCWEQKTGLEDKPDVKCRHTTMLKSKEIDTLLEKFSHIHLWKKEIRSGR